MSRTVLACMAAARTCAWVAGLLLTAAIGPAARPAPAVAAAPAQEPAPTGIEPLTLAESVRLALEHSPRLQAALSRLRQDEARLDQATAPLRPRVDLAAEAARQQQLSGPEEGLGLSLSYGQILGRPEEVRLQTQRAELLPQVARLELDRERGAVVAEVEGAFLTVVESQSAVQAGRQQLQAAQEALRVARQRHAEGALSDADLLAAELAEARARQALLAAEQAVELAWESLYRLMGVAPPAVRRPIEPPELGELAEASEPASALRQRALSARPDVLQAKLAVEDARLAVRQAEQGFRPTLQLSATYQWKDPARGVSVAVDDDTRLQLTLSHGGLSSVPPGLSQSYRLGLTLAWNLTDGGQVRAGVREAQEALRQAQLQLEQLEAAVALELAQRQADLARALQVVGVAEQALAEATARHEAVRRQGDLGLATPVELLQAQAQLAQARHEHLRALAQAARARTALAVASGVGWQTLVQMVAGGQT